MLFRSKKDELVQPQTSQASPAPVSPAPAPVEPDDGKTLGGSQTTTQVASADPKELAKKDNPVIANRAEAEVLADLAPKAATVPPAPEPQVVIQVMYLKEDSFVYKEKNEKSQRTWLLKKGQLLETQTAGDGWISVRTMDGKKGFVRDTVLSTDKPEKSK